MQGWSTRRLHFTPVVKRECTPWARELGGSAHSEPEIRAAPGPLPAPPSSHYCGCPGERPADQRVCPDPPAPGWERL
eukprot:scaffold48578_cov16-Tisochrysis_lutea.AAC.1